MTDVEKLKKTKDIINDLHYYMEYQPTKEQNEAFDVVIELLNEAIDKSTVPCFKCKHYVETDAEWKSGICLFVGKCQTFAEETCDHGERKKKMDKFDKADDLNKAIKLIQGIEEDGRNVTFEHVDALNIAIKALEFIDENFHKTFIDYLNGEQI